MTSLPSSPAASRHRRRGKVAAFGVLALTMALVLSAAPSSAATAPTLGAASSYAVLGATTVTNTGETVISGDLGVSPGTAVTGFPPGIVTNGTIQTPVTIGSTSASAQLSATAAYNELAGQECLPADNLTGQDLGGLTLTPGVYCFTSTAQLTGVLTLNALGNPDAVFVFQIGSALTTAPDSSVLVTNSEAACNVFWQVGSAATLDTGTDFVGTVIAGTEAITALTNATVMGRLISLNAAVTLDTNTVSADSCAATTGTGGTTDGTTGGTTGGTDGTTDGATTTDGTDTGATDGTTDDAATDDATTGGAPTAPAGSSGEGTPTGQVPPTSTTTPGGDTDGGAADGGTDGSSTTDGGITRGGLPATGASTLGMALLGGTAIAVGAGLTHLSTRGRGSVGRHFGASAPGGPRPADDR